MRRFLLQVDSDFLQFAPSRACIIEEIAELARVGFDGENVLLVSRVTLGDQDLVFWPARLANSLH